MTRRGPAGPVVIGLDVGTTATKAVAYDVAGPWRHVARRGYRLAVPEPGWSVQDPEEVRAAVVDALREAVGACGSTRILAVSVGTAMHALMALDDRRVPMTPLITWADGRAAPEARALRERDLARDLHRRTGTPVHAMSPLAKLLWLRAHDADLMRRVRWWVGLKDWVLLVLTGRLRTEVSSASGTGLMAMSTLAWDAGALALAGIRVDQLPDIGSPTLMVGMDRAVARAVGLASGEPVVLGAADGPLGNLGVGAVGPGVAGLSLGTSGALRLVSPRPAVDEDGGLFCYALTESAWVIGGAISNGGVVAQWAAEALAAPGEDTSAPGWWDSLLGQAAGIPPGSGGLVMLPFLLPERAPLADDRLAGAYLGLHREHGRGHLVRAALEGVALQLGLLFWRVQAVAPVTSVRMTGGALRSPLLRSLVAAALPVPVRMSDEAEGTARGAAALALMALGRADSLAEAIAGLSTEGEGELVVPTADLVRAHDALGARVGELLAALEGAVGQSAVGRNGIGSGSDPGG